jgi:hypothetical protein
MYPDLLIYLRVKVTRKKIILTDDTRTKKNNSQTSYVLIKKEHPNC